MEVDQLISYAGQVESKYNELWKFSQFQTDSYDYDQFINQNKFILYENLPIVLKNAVILIEFCKSSGFGDLLIGYKTTKIITDHFKDAEVYVVSQTPEEVKQYQSHYLNDVVNIYHVSQITNKFIKKMKITNPEVKIVILSLALGTSLDSEVIFDNHIPHIYIDEYHGWRANNQLQDVEPSNFNIYLIPGFGLNECDLISCGININKINNSHLSSKDSPYTQYFGYTSTSGDPHADCITYLYSFIMVILLKEYRYTKKKRKPIQIDLVCPKMTLNELFNLVMYGFSTKWSGGYRHYTKTNEIMGYELNFRKETETNLLIDDRKNLIIKFHQYLPHQEMLNLMEKSKSPLLITGDQSLAEAISHEKFFIYQPHEWKAKLIESFLNYCDYKLNNQNSQNKQIFLKFIRLSTQSLHDVHPHNFSYKAHISTLARYLSSSVIEKQAKDIFQSIKQNFDIKSAIISVIKQCIVNDKIIDDSLQKTFGEIVGVSILRDNFKDDLPMNDTFKKKCIKMINNNNLRFKSAKRYRDICKSAQYITNHPSRKRLRLCLQEECLDSSCNICSNRSN